MMKIYTRFIVVMASALMASALMGISSTLYASPPTLKWKIEDQFKAPESAIYDSNRDVIYVSNINGQGTDKDGNGFISKVGPDGSMIALEWVGGLNGPKGMALVGNMLYVSDITALVEIDIEAGAVTQVYEADGAVFMNDVAADGAGNVYVSDMATNTIHKLSDGSLDVWVRDEKLENPNGLLVEGNNMIVGSWGKMNPDFSTDVPGHMKTVSLDSGMIKALGSTEAIGNLDGVEPDGKGNYFVTDWVAGKLLLINPAGESETLLTLEQGSADLGVVPDKNLLLIPMMMNGSLLAYQFGM